MITGVPKGAAGVIQEGERGKDKGVFSSGGRISHPLTSSMATRCQLSSTELAVSSLGEHQGKGGKKSEMFSPTFPRFGGE